MNLIGLAVLRCNSSRAGLHMLLVNLFHPPDCRDRKERNPRRGRKAAGKTPSEGRENLPGSPKDLPPNREKRGRVGREAVSQRGRSLRWQKVRRWLLSPSAPAQPPCRDLFHVFHGNEETDHRDPSQSEDAGIPGGFLSSFLVLLSYNFKIFLFPA